jgi:bacteriorhodopsin
MGNSAILYNGFQNNSGAVDSHITVRGSSFLFAVCAIMGTCLPPLACFRFSKVTCQGASAVGCVAWSFSKPRQQRIFFYLCAMINLIAAIAYFTLGSNLGWAAIPVEFRRSNPKVAGVIRQVFYVRYIDWFLTTPLLLLDLLLTCRLPWPTIMYTIAMDGIMVVTGLVGALVQSRYKWGFFVFGCAAFLFVAYTVVFEGRSYARALGSDVSRTYLICGVWTIGLWFLYPIAWGLSEGGNVISSDSEAIFYGVLDVLAKPVFCFLLLWGHRRVDIARLGLHVRGASESAPRNGTHHEKGHNGVGNDTTSTGIHEGTTSAPVATV